MAAEDRYDGHAAGGGSGDIDVESLSITWLGEPHARMAKGQQGEPGPPEGRKSTGQRRGEA
jgi:hypothetical protein